MRPFAFLALSASLAVSACVTAGPGPAAPPAPPRDTHEQIVATLWAQTAAERRALMLGAYRQAALTLDAALGDPDWTAALEQTGERRSLPTAVIMDLDETVLDNARVQGELVHRRAPFTPEVWSRWAARPDAGALPGAAAFITAAQARGVTVFYVTNRMAEEEAATRDALTRLGITLPAGRDTVLTRGERPDWTAEKASRRAFLARDFRILMLFGDDLGDFAPVRAPDGSTLPVAAREALVDSHAAWWGERWVIFANPMYGSWEPAALGGAIPADDAEALRRRIEAIRGFR